MAVVVVVSGGLEPSRHAIFLALPADIFFLLLFCFFRRFSRIVLCYRVSTGHLSRSSRQPTDSGLGASETRVISSTVAKGPGPAGEGP